MNETTDRPADNLDALFALARAHRPDTSAAEFAFETRLMARLREQHHSSSIWAKVSWRLIPILGACVLALTIWQAETSSDSTDADAIAGLTNPVATDMGSN